MKTPPLSLFPRIVAVALMSFAATGITRGGGKVAAWGDNTYGQCLLPNGLNNVKAVAGGQGHSLALAADGTVTGWGLNSSGQASPPHGLSDVRAIAAGAAHSLALLANGTVVGWGSYGLTNPPAGLATVVAIAAGSGHDLALKADGTVVAWGANNYSQTNVPAGLSDVVALAAGHGHNLALKADGTVVAWGWNSYGQTNVPIGLSNVRAIAAGRFHSLALRVDGTVIGWGDGFSTHTNASHGFSNVVAIAAGTYYNLAIRSDGTVVADDLVGALDLPSGMANVSAIAAGFAHNLAIVPDGPPEILVQPASAGVPFQSNIVFSVAARGFEPLSYRWFFNGYPLTDSARISGATNASLMIADAQFSDTGTFTVVVSNAFGSVQSTGAVLTVISPPIITLQPTGRTMIAGTNITLTAAATGTPPLSYQWLLEGDPIPGATKTSLSLSNIQSSQSGNYSLRVTNIYGVTESSNALVTVLESLPYILTQPSNRSGFLGGVATFSVNARGSTPLHYQWRFNGADLSK